jgi:hypothetical protein
VKVTDAFVAGPPKAATTDLQREPVKPVLVAVVGARPTLTV